MTLPIFMLVCDELPDRTAAAKKHMAEMGLNPTYWKGFYGVSWGLETSKEYDPGKRLPPGHVGLNLGSWAMWLHAYLETDIYAPNPNTPIIFFEDDAVVRPTFSQDLTALNDDLKVSFPDWDLVFIGTCGAEPQIWHKVTERIGGPDSHLCRMSDPFGTHAMMVRRRAIPVMLEHMRAAERNLDQQLWQRVLQPGHLKWCAVLPTLVTQRTYDYQGGGSPEWAPSTLRPGDEPKRVYDPAGLVVGDRPGRPSAETTALTLSLIDPFACLYRGEQMEDHGKRVATGGSVPLSQCARLYRPCHSKRGVGPVVDHDGDEAVACETCPHRLEMAPSKDRERLPLPEGHFNPGMCMYDGRLIMATRDSWGHSALALWELKNTLTDWTGAWAATPLGSFRSTHRLAPRLEDPRLFVAPHPQTGELRLHAMLSLPDGYPPKVVKVGYVRFEKDLSGIEVTEVLDSPQNSVYEKNWMPIVAGKELRWLYSSKPVHVVLGAGENWQTPNNLPWTGGVIRGGATPVYAVSMSEPYCQPVYYHFFHGVLKRPEGSVYTLGCSVFEAQPPYRVLRQTPMPLVWPDLPAEGESVVKRYVVFPGGAVPHAGAWHVCSGIDDTFCRITRIPFAAVEAALHSVEETGGVVSIRDTHIAKGITAEEFS